MTPKRYRLLQSLPGIPAGTEFSEAGGQIGGEHYVPSSWLSDPTWFEEIKPGQWKPKMGATIWMIADNFRVVDVVWLGGKENRMLLLQGRVFPTFELAHSAAQHLKKALAEWWEKEGNGV